jgi:hypothetical protein
MTEFEGTPGPWFVSDRPSGHRAEVAAKEPGGPVILFPASAAWLSPAERQANARLAAAAPELLRACEAIIAGWGHQDGVLRAVQLARAAIEKAAGG